MRVLIFIALCLAVASAGYTNRNRFNRLLRALQHQQQQDQEQGFYGSQGLSLNNIYDSDDQDQDDEDTYNQQQCQRNGQCHRSQRYGSLNLDDDETEYDSDEQDDQQYEQDQDQYQQQGQGRRQRQQHQQQRRRQQQQRNQCQPRFQLLQALEQANTQLASKLYQQAKQENDDKNTVVAPAALQLALAAIQRGARGNTKRQIQRIIGAGMNKQQNRQAHTALQQSLKGQDPLQKQTGQNQQAKVKTTTTIVINQRNHAQQQFVQAVKACLNTQVKKCNFQRQAQQCRQQINQHIAQQTNQKLRQTVPQDAVTENTKMIVVNTAQLNAKWGRQFRQQQTTKQGRFYPLGCQQPKNVQVLQSQGQFNYYEDEQMQVVGLPTQQQELTMYVIVPKNKDGLNQVEKSQIQDGQQLKQLLEQAEQQQEQVQIELPKFQIKHKLDAKQTLRKQGVQDVFDADQADLSGIHGQQQQEQQQRRRQQQYGQDDEEQYQQQDQDDEQRQQNLHVNKLIHQATIKVDEQGIKAARPGRQGQQQQHQQYDDQEQDQEQDDDENDEQEQQYRQRQQQRQDMLEGIFGQNQRQRQQRQHRNRRQQRGQYQFQDQDQDQYNQYNQNGEQKQVRANRAFAFAIKHNPSNQIVMVGRVVDATQKPQRQQHQGQRQQGQSLNGVDQQ